MEDIDIENVLKAAGPRDRPSEEIERRIREHVRIEWRSIITEERARRRRRTSLALAAGLAIAALGAWLAGPMVAGTGETVATIAIASGEIRAKTSWLGRWRPVESGEIIGAGAILKTGPGGRAAMTLPGGLSARLDSDTQVTLASAGRLQISNGALYVDSGRSAAHAAAFEVETPAGSLHHLGTQYEVRLLGSEVRVRVREGRVEWTDDGSTTASGSAGDQLTIGPGGAVQRGATPLFGESWDWVAAATPGIDIEGHSLAEFLDWAGREMGCDVVFASAGIENEAAGIVVHGSISGLTPAQALDAVLATTRLQAYVDDGHIVISAQLPGRQPSVASSSANPTT